MYRIGKLFFSLLILVAAGAWLYATPLLTVQAMRKATAGRDEAELARFVDRQALTESLKDRFNAGKKAREKAESQDNPLASVGVAITSTFVTPMVELLTTPDNISRMLRGEHPRLLRLAPPTPPADAERAPDTDTTMAYETYNRVLITITKKDATGEPVRLIFTRNGLWAWKLSEVRLPR